MNENINLCEILKDCPKGTKLYTPLAGEVKLKDVRLNRGKATDSIKVTYKNEGRYLSFTKEGLYYDVPNGECLLFPSKDQRDWSKWKCPKPNFDPKTLQPFDKILVRRGEWDSWYIELFGFCDEDNYTVCSSGTVWSYSIPYNEETKHLLGTKGEAPEYYRYWED